MEVQRTTSPASPFNMTPGSRTSATDAGAFERQLSTALTESLSRLGLTAGQVNISIKGGATPSARQVVITWDNAAGSDAAAGGRPAERGNPFAMSLPARASSLPESAALTAGAGGRLDTPWSPWSGARDSRDAIPETAGRVTDSGAPEIRCSSTPIANQHQYAGFGALNPYFTTPSNPLRQGYVRGFDNWFRDAFVSGGSQGPVPANRLYFATEEGAQEALRLVQQYNPSAELVEQPWGGGPYNASSQMYFVNLGGDKVLNAGMLLGGYYNHGYGVTPASDMMLASAIRNA